MSVAKEFSDTKTAKIVQLNKDFALKHGLNYDELVRKQNENELDEKSKDTSPIPVSMRGKKFSFKKGKDTVLPKDALRAYFDKTIRE